MMKKSCFAIMPFEGLADIDQTIRESVEDCGLKYVRSDREHCPGNILSQIMRAIEQASVIVVDMTGQNANVFYELGIAHKVKGPDRVVLISQMKPGKEPPFDVAAFRVLKYENSPEGRTTLRKELPIRLRRAMETNAHEEFWNVIRGRLPRTQMLVRELGRIRDRAGSKGLKGVTIRIAAGLSSIAISNREPADLKLGTEYCRALLAERDTLRAVLLKGARLKAVLNPPRRFAETMLPERLRVRYKRLIGLLEGRSDILRNRQLALDDLQAIRRCEFTLSPVSMPNIFIIGEEVAYEGMKRVGAGGFEMTHCETNPEAVRELIRDFDRYFEESHHEMIRTHPPDGQLTKQLRRFYKDATGEELR
jgi:hypothetical protein